MGLSSISLSYRIQVVKLQAFHFMIKHCTVYKCLPVTKQQFPLDFSPYHGRWKEREECLKAKLKKMLKHTSDNATLSSLEQGIAAKQSKMSDVKANDSPVTEKIDADSAFTNSLDPLPYEASWEQWITWVKAFPPIVLGTEPIGVTEIPANTTSKDASVPREEKPVPKKHNHPQRKRRQRHNSNAECKSACAVVKWHVHSRRAKFFPQLNGHHYSDSIMKQLDFQHAENL